ncbi:MAG: hypothetical protein RLZZ74_2218 [Cyanobacteriota bacterium]|jgi:hypothetical protein
MLDIDLDHDVPVYIPPNIMYERRSPFNPAVAPRAS